MPDSQKIINKTFRPENFQKMNVSDEFLYCSQCGSKLIKACKFCTKCGAKIKTVVEEKSTENDSSVCTKSFNDYFDLKSNERTGFFKRKERKRTRNENPTSKKAASKFSFLARETVTVNIGLMEPTDKNDYNLVL